MEQKKKQHQQTKAPAAAATLPTINDVRRSKRPQAKNLKSYHQNHSRLISICITVYCHKAVCMQKKTKVSGTHTHTSVSITFICAFWIKICHFRGWTFWVDWFTFTIRKCTKTHSNFRHRSFFCYSMNKAPTNWAWEIRQFFYKGCVASFKWSFFPLSHTLLPSLTAFSFLPSKIHIVSYLEWKKLEKFSKLFDNKMNTQNVCRCVYIPTINTQIQIFRTLLCIRIRIPLIQSTLKIKYGYANEYARIHSKREKIITIIIICETFSQYSVFFQYKHTHTHTITKWMWNLFWRLI